MTSAAAYQERVDEASELLAWIRSHLNDEEREHLALELLDTTRRGDGYDDVIGPWLLTVVVREHPDYGWQLKEIRNLEASGELFAGTDIPAASLMDSSPGALTF